MAEASTSALGSPPYFTTIGAVAFGGAVGLMLYGLTMHQMYRYLRMYPSDTTFLKSFVVIVFILETFHMALWLFVGYHYLIIQPFNCGAGAEGHWSVRLPNGALKLTIISTACTVIVTQCFYARRVYLLDSTRYKWLVVPAVVSLFVSKGFAVAAGVEAFKMTPSIADFQHISWLVSVSYGLAGLTDVLLAGTLVFVFRRSRTGTRRGDCLLDTLILYTINTGVLTSIFSILAFVFALVLPGNLIYAGISIVGTKRLRRPV
ncbi:hypothetical protein C8Q77DRAFT_464832 [Trametes polyzona]|nr:hypothetical protein C8Q77DRAFT_464832 [Trametes polyzona]